MRATFFLQRRGQHGEAFFDGRTLDAGKIPQLGNILAVITGLFNRRFQYKRAAGHSGADTSAELGVLQNARESRGLDFAFADIFMAVDAPTEWDLGIVEVPDIDIFEADRLLEELSKSGALQAAVWKVIHVAGTNGKGSVCAMMDSICRAQGYRTGLFTSPHLVTFRERIRMNGDMISEEAVADGLTSIRDLVANWDPHPTFFEVVTALALKHFSDRKVEVVILETGLGGLYNAYNLMAAFALGTALGLGPDYMAPRLASVAAHYYAVGCSMSKVTAAQFAEFCRRIGAPLQPAPAGVKKLFDGSRIDAVFEVQECAFDAIKLRDRMELHEA